MWRPSPRHTPSLGVIRLIPDRWAAGGRALGRHEGRVVLVAGAVPGDSVTAEIRRDRGRFVEAVARSIDVPSRGRRSVPCPIQDRCGGCPLMPMDEGAQQDAKRRFVIDALERIAKVRTAPVEAIDAPRPWLGYRGKIELVFGRDREGRSVLGYHAHGDESGIVDVPACAVADPRVQPLVDLVRTSFLEAPSPPLGARVAFRVAATGSDRLIVFFGEVVPAATRTEFAQVAMRREPSLTGVASVVAETGRRGGAKTVSIAGRPWLSETILGTTFRVPPAAFLQVHPRAAEVLGRHLLEATTGVESVIELYSGVGGFGLAFTRRGASTTIVEADAAAVSCGEEAAERNGISGVRFVRSDAGRFLERVPGSARHDLLIADPPRTGLGRGVVDGIARLAPRRIALVSCDPATMARDIAGLTGHGYRLERVTPFDLFPQTAHVEAVAWLAR